jgi:hypothetical protein
MRRRYNDRLVKELEARELDVARNNKGEPKFGDNKKALRKWVAEKDSEAQKDKSNKQSFCPMTGLWDDLLAVNTGEGNDDNEE